MRFWDLTRTWIPKSQSGSLFIALGILALSPVTGKGQSKTQEAAATIQLKPTPPPETASRVSFNGNKAFDKNQLRQALADPLLSIQNQGLTLPLADDTAY